MLEQNDLEMIRKIMQETLSNNNNAILSEVDSLRDTTVKYMDEINKNIEELKQYSRIAKLENDNTALLLKLIDELSKRVEELEKRTA